MAKNLVMIEAIQVITIADINLKDFRDQYIYISEYE